MRDRQRWRYRCCWVLVFIAFHLLMFFQCSYAHRKVPQRKLRQVGASADGIPGVWSSWGPWSSCSSTCGAGVAVQSRRCVPQDPGGQRRTEQPGPLYAPQPHEEGHWDRYAGRRVSALRPTYSLHVDADPPALASGQPSAQQDPSVVVVAPAREAPNPHAFPLYGDRSAANQPEAGVYGSGRPTNGERALRQRYRPPSNRGSLPLYRQDQLSNRDRPLPAANGASPSRFGALIGREAAPLYTTEGSTYQNAASQPRQRSLANWRASMGNRRSLNGHNLQPSNRSHIRSVIRPGQYGYGKVPSDFKLHSSMSHLLAAVTPGQRTTWERSPRQPRTPGAVSPSEGGVRPEAGPERRERRAAGERGATRAGFPAELKGHLSEGLRQDFEGQGDDARGKGSLESLGQPTLGAMEGGDGFRGLALEEQVGDKPDRVGPDVLSRPRPSWPLEQPAPAANCSAPDIAAAVFVYPAAGIPESRRGSWTETSSGPSPRNRAPRHSPEAGSGREATGEDAPRGSMGRSYGVSVEPGGEPSASGEGPRSAGRTRRQEYRVDGDNVYQDWNSHQLLTATCPGSEKQYRACHILSCSSGNADPRRAQCAAFNRRQFMGRYYEWEPFTEVQRDQRCELNCRPSGYRFYVRHADKVLDGTPCEANSTDVCVAGECLTAGCDGMLGSGARPDKCGVCGGNDSTCQRVFGIFEDSQINVGYHKIITIPSRATKISVTEMARSRNYLALRSRTGQSIINGNWAIDRPGVYEAAGTTFIYKRPTESSGESFYAEGPTTESLDVYMIFQQDNPGIHYEFVLPVENPVQQPPIPLQPSQSYGSPTTGGLREVSALESSSVLTHRRNLGTPHRNAGMQGGGAGTYHRNAVTRQGNPVPPRTRGGQRDRRLQEYSTDAQEDPAQAQPVYRWTSQSATQCSVSCGKGFQYPILRCVAQDTQELVPDGYCDSASKPTSVPEACNTHPCPAFWSVGPWSQCSKTCGRGIHHRQVLCRQAYANRTVAVHPQSCSHLEKPNSTQPCETRACTHWHIQSDWESCSVPCGVGQRKRSIRCVSNQGNVVGEGECSAKQKPTESETCDMGPCVKTWFYTEWSSKCSVDCGIGLQKRSVLCLNNYNNDPSPESCEGPRPTETRACTRPHCQRQLRWYASPWNQCPVQCGNGTQNRDLICVIKLGNNFTVMAPSECAHLDKPPSVQPCNAGPCGSRWFLSDWNECSKSCLGGVQRREVKCLDEAGFASSRCDEAQKPSQQRMCNNHPCVPELDENCKDKYYNCPVVVQARLCVYSYYKMVCCASCTHAERRGTDPRRHRVSGRRGGGGDGG